MNVLESLHENALADSVLLRKNDEAGDIFDTRRDVDFTFKTTHHERANDLAEFVRGKNFGDAQVRASNDGTFWVSVIINMPINQSLICSISAFMLLLGRLFYVEYDGWGSIIQSASSIP